MAGASTNRRPSASVVSEVTLSDAEFEVFRRLARELLGIDFAPIKKPLISGRLAKRLRHLGFTSYSQYLQLVQSSQGRDELERMIDLLTTHETYFFREEAHFAFLADQLLPQWPRNRPLRVWSAASSTGEEAYSIAMVLVEQLGTAADWRIFGSDISTEVLKQAVEGIYPMARAKGLSQELLQRYCLKGVGHFDGYFCIDPMLRERCEFGVVNLSMPLNGVGMFDLIFLRNVLIYFDIETKRDIVRRIVQQLAPGGYLFIGHSESLNGICDGVSAVRPTIYRKSGGGAMSRQIYLHPGEWFWGDNAHIRTVLGSCVAVSFWHARIRVGGICHYLLPERPQQRGRQMSPDPRYGLDVIAMMATKARQFGPSDAYVIKVFGGGSVAEGPAAISVGERNVEVANNELRRLGYSVAAADVGGQLSRHLVFDLATGDVWLKRVDCVPFITTRTR